MATTTLGRRHPYIPWLLCTLRAHARARGSCLLEATTAPPTYRGNSSGLRSNGPVDGGRISKRGIASVLLIYASQVWSCAHACTMRATQRETKRDKGAVLAQTTMKTTNVFRKVGQQGDTTIDGYKKSSCTYIDTSKQPSETCPTEAKKPTLRYPQSNRPTHHIRHTPTQARGLARRMYVGILDKAWCVHGLLRRNTTRSFMTAAHAPDDLLQPRGKPDDGQSRATRGRRREPHDHTPRSVREAAAGGKVLDEDDLSRHGFAQG